MTENILEVYTSKDFRDWLEKNHMSQKEIIVVLHKKHTGKMKTNAAELMKEAICFGWIDTTLNRIDQDRYAIKYKKRTEKSKWSYNTLSYAKELLKKGLMTPEGIKFYKEGLKKKPHDFGIPKNPDMPKELEIELNKKKNIKLLEKFMKLSPSSKKNYYRLILRAKLPETKKKRIMAIIKNIKTQFS